MSFLEKGEEKQMLTPNLIKYVELSILADSKAAHMSLIAKYYSKILEEFYEVNSGDQEAHERSTDSDV